MKQSGILELFSEVLRTKGWFFYLSPEQREALDRDSYVYFEGYPISRPEWLNHSLRPVVAAINNGKQELFSPDTTDRTDWEVIRDRYGFSWRGKRKPIPLPDGSVVEVFTLFLTVYEKCRGEKYYGCSTELGLFGHGGCLVVVKTHHYKEHVRKLRHRIEEYLRKHPHDVIRTGKFLGLE